MAKQEIRLKIKGMSFPFTIDAEKEELYRLAEGEVNNYFTTIKKKNIPGWEDENYLAFTALKFAIANASMRQEREVTSEDLQKLEGLSTEIDRYINALEK